MPFDLLGSLSRGEDHQNGVSGGHREDREVATAGDAQEADTAQCSRRGCKAAASWLLEWNNPRVHTPDRRKTWAACDEHRDHLAGFLTERGFLKNVRPLEPEPSAAAEHETAQEAAQETEQATGEEAGDHQTGEQR